MPKKTKVVAITGGENSGKSSSMVYFSEELPRYGIQPFIIHEAATSLFSSGLNPEEISNTQEIIIRKMLADEALFQNITQHYTGINKPVIICDRSVLDCQVFCKPGEYKTILKKLKTSPHAVKESYDSAIHLVTTAEGKEKVFLATFKDNPFRKPMTLEVARARDKELQHAYLGIKKLSIIPNQGTFTMKKRSALKHLLSHLGIPVPQEIEYKFLVPKFFSRDDIPVPNETVALTQHYLDKTPFLSDMKIPSGAEKTIERIRMRESHGNRTFIYTVKAFLPGESEPYELEDFISEREFVSLISYANGQPIRKDRTYFIWKNQYFEFDQFAKKIDAEGNNLLELEVTKKQQKFILPDFMPNLVDVSKNPKYRNEYIALGLR